MAILLWFTQDLRLSDHPALTAAIAMGEPIIPVYMVDAANPYRPQGASLWWLHKSLNALGLQIREQQGELCIVQGGIDQLIEIAQLNQCNHIFFSCSHEPWLAEQQQQLNLRAAKIGIGCRQFAGQLLFEPATIFNKQGKPFQVFTPFYRHCLSQLTIKNTSARTAQIPWQQATKQQPNTRLEKSLTLIDGIPKKPNWAKHFSQCWQPGEEGAFMRIEDCLPTLSAYKSERDIPSIDATSGLSAHLHFGEISPRQLWRQVAAYWPEDEAAPFLRQLIWREFSFYLLHHYAHIINQPFKASFAQFPWQTPHPKTLQAWQQGQTGYPIVDAGMRQLWQTGWMHNRVRMVVASFLTKHLRIHWQYGFDWFWDTLVDADLANNIAGWQWVAGCGADAAPYFRIFNPVVQSEKFDPEGDYIRAYIPELAKLPNKFIHTPWLAPESILKAADIKLGDNYPLPIVDHKTAREQALAAYAAIKEAPVL